MEVFRLRFPCPVPEGHRVRLRWYFQPSGGTGPLLQRPHEPVVDDLDTGVRYAPGWTLHSGGDERVRELTQLAHDIPESLRLERTVEGRVVKATVVHMPANHRHPLQTRLMVDAVPPSSAYR